MEGHVFNDVQQRFFATLVGAAMTFDETPALRQLMAERSYSRYSGELSFTNKRTWPRVPSCDSLSRCLKKCRPARMRSFIKAGVLLASFKHAGTCTSSVSTQV